MEPEDSVVILNVGFGPVEDDQGVAVAGPDVLKVDARVREYAPAAALPLERARTPTVAPDDELPLGPRRSFNAEGQVRRILALPCDEGPVPPDCHAAPIVGPTAKALDAREIAVDDVVERK